MYGRALPLLLLTFALGAATPPARVAASGASESPRRYVEGMTLISTALPAIRVRVGRGFRYVGKFDFTIRDVARGERHVFVDARRGRVRRMFIAQFEEVLPTSEMTYNYSFKDAPTRGGHKFRQNTYAFSGEANRRENPRNEGVLTADFLKAKGFALEDEWMMSRFVTVPDAERKHELILYYVERVAPTGRRLADFYDGENSTEVWTRIGRELTARSEKNFTVLD